MEDGRNSGQYAAHYKSRILTKLLELQKQVQKTKPHINLITNQELIAIIGEPIETDGIMQGSMNYSNGDASADITIPLKGPKGKASVSIKGDKREDVWIYEAFYITIKDTQEQINLLDKNLEGI